MTFVAYNIYKHTIFIDITKISKYYKSKQIYILKSTTLKNLFQFISEFVAFIIPTKSKLSFVPDKADHKTGLAYEMLHFKKLLQFFLMVGSFQNM